MALPHESGGNGQMWKCGHWDSHLNLESSIHFAFFDLICEDDKICSYVTNSFYNSIEVYE